MHGCIGEVLGSHLLWYAYSVSLHMLRKASDPVWFGNSTFQNLDMEFKFSLCFRQLISSAGKHFMFYQNIVAPY